MTTFKGFQSPNFTQIPNEYLDYTFSPECDLSKVQMQIMNFVFRETFGWQDKHKILVFSATDIMALLNIKKRNTVVDALNGLVEDKKFLEAIEVSKLSKKVRSNIETSLRRKMQPRQKLYRLNLVEGKKRPWDNVEEPHTDINERKLTFKGSNQMVTSNEMVITSSNRLVTTTSNQTVTTLGPESFEAVRAKEALNKGLNKGLNKEEEEEEKLSSIQLKKSVKKYLTTQLKYDSTLLAAIAEQMAAFNITDLTEAEMESQHNYMVGKNEIERITDWAFYFVNGIAMKNNNPKNKVSGKESKSKGRKGKVIREELIPESWKQNGPIPPTKESTMSEEEKQAIWEQVKKLNASS